MSKKENDISPDLITAVESLKNTETRSEEARQAVEAIEMASQMMDAIMAGRQLDLAFYSLYANSSIKRIKKSRKKKNN